MPFKPPMFPLPNLCPSRMDRDPSQVNEAKQTVDHVPYADLTGGSEVARLAL